MDFYDPFPRPFRSTIAQSSEESDKKKEHVRVESAPWPEYDSVLPGNETAGLVNASPPNKHATTWPNFMNLPRESTSNEDLSNISLSARIGGHEDLPMPVPAFGSLSQTPGLYLESSRGTQSDLGHGQQSSVPADNSSLDSTFMRDKPNSSTQSTEVQADSANNYNHAFAQIPSEKSADDKERKFSCTFCRHRFKTKYDWSRHEKSRHLDLEVWICAPESGLTRNPSTGQDVCAYCTKPQPSPDHIAEHNHSNCVVMKPTFNRKDHLVQHLRLVHRLTKFPPLDGWRVHAPPFVCRCGFCGQSLTSWGERTDHLAGHFRKGATMRDWQGEHGFTPDVAAQVENSIPPHLIADQC